MSRTHGPIWVGVVKPAETAGSSCSARLPVVQFENTTNVLMALGTSRITASSEETEVARPPCAAADVVSFRALLKALYEYMLPAALLHELQYSNFM